MIRGEVPSPDHRTRPPSSPDKHTRPRPQSLRHPCWIEPGTCTGFRTMTVASCLPVLRSRSIRHPPLVVDGKSLPDHSCE